MRFTTVGERTSPISSRQPRLGRDVTGERIRDKIALSKKKGIWMGGYVPLGYDVTSRKLIPNEPEADLVRRIFNRFVRLGSTTQLTRPNGKTVPIPTAFYYITVDPFRYPWNTTGSVDVACFLIPQDADRHTPLDDFLVDLATIEQQTRLKFFPRWPDTSHFAATPLGTGSDAGNIRHRLLRQLY